MRGALWLVVSMALAALVGGCLVDTARLRTEPPRSEFPSISTSVLPTSSPSSRSSAVYDMFLSHAMSVAREHTARAQRAEKVAAFMAKTRPVKGGVVGAGFSLDPQQDVQYLSPTDAAAELSNCDTPDPCTMIVLSTQDNWAHATGLAIPGTLADYVSFVPLGQGAVGIKPEVFDAPTREYPPFVLYPNGRATALHISHEPRALEAGGDLICTSVACGFLHEVGAKAEAWAADVDNGEIHPIHGVPDGEIWQHVPGRGGAVLSVSGSDTTVASQVSLHKAPPAPTSKLRGRGVWRFAESDDNTRTWRTTDVRLPPGGEPRFLTRDVDHSEEDAVGPRHAQATAWMDFPGEENFLPNYLRELWRTEDEKRFRRVPLPWEGMSVGGLPFAGMVFASDGALLLAEANGSPSNLCPGGACHPGRIWQLPPGSTRMKALAHAPRLSGGADGLDILQVSGGGMIVGRTGPRTIAVSPDGYTWTKVTPGR